MKLWATYDAAHADADVMGDREGLQALAAAAREALPTDLILDEPPSAWDEHGRPLVTIRIEPRDHRERRVNFSNVESVLVISGAAAEVARIVGGSLTRLSHGPEAKNGVPSHVHLDPTSDPEGRYYAPGSSSVVVGFTPTT